MNETTIACIVVGLFFAAGGIFGVLVHHFWTRDLADPRRTPTPGLMDEDERSAAFLEAPNHRLFNAVLADLQEFAVEVSDRALDPDLPESKIRFHLGGADALLEFLEKLQQREREARLTEAELAAKAAAETPPEETQ